MICKECGVDKTPDSYYVSNRSRCKDCVKASVRQRRKTNPKVQEYDRKRGNRQSSEYLKKYREKYPKKYSAHNMVNNYIRDGKLVKVDTCECGSTFAVEAHHDDYNKPLEVRWLCAVCHKRWHAVHGEALNPF